MLPLDVVAGQNSDVRATKTNTPHNKKMQKPVFWV